MAEWFEEWFNEDYLSLYPHRDAAEAERLVRLLTRILPWQSGWRVLDVACGAGRHAAALAAAGARPVGIDLSPALLRHARGAGVPLVRGDMRRLPVRAGSVDLAVNLFTSFGYFERDDEHAAVLRGIAATLKPGGWFVMDFLNADTVRTTLVPVETQVLGGAPVRVTRELIDGERFVRKTIETADGRRFAERVRLFTPGDLEAMMGAAGLDVQGRYGDYDGGPLRPGAPRSLFIARRVG